MDSKELKEELKTIGIKLDNIDTKLSCHLERIAKAEVWIRGHGTVLMFIGTTILFIIGYLIKGV
jgi:hypothetical protein